MRLIFLGNDLYITLRKATDLTRVWLWVYPLRGTRSWRLVIWWLPSASVCLLWKKRPASICVYHEFMQQCWPCMFSLCQWRWTYHTPYISQDTHEWRWHWIAVCMPIIVINMNDTSTVLSDQPWLQVIGTIMVFFELVEYFSVYISTK